MNIVNESHPRLELKLKFEEIVSGLSIDIVFEILIGHNMIGLTSYMPGRIASFFGDELVVGSFYHGFVLIFLSYIILQKSNNYILIVSIIIIFLLGYFSLIDLE